MAQDDKSSTAATEVLGAGNKASDFSGVSPGTRIGHYVIVRMLGEGGMGQVYLAEQLQPVQREVALKLLPAHVTSPLTRAYFEVERQALAQMQHPAIAQVFDAGASDVGQTYIAMERVDGVPITEYCTSRKLSLASRLKLFQRVCHGVQHAHQKGVIHRDLKPGNVLVHEVDGVAQPKIIDFGIAIGSEGIKGAEGEYAGTVTYMSPEQSSGEIRDIDTRSDVYSLGVMLFETLTGDNAASLVSHAFKSGADLRTTLLRIDGVGSNADATQSELLDAACRLPAELRAVLRKALQPERSERYDSAAALGEDLDRYLQRRPLLAVPPTRAYQSRKFVSRHRFGITASVLVAGALIAGVVLALIGQQRAMVAAQQAQAEAAKAERTSAFITGILGGIDPSFAKGRDTSLMRAVLDRAADKAGSELADEPEVRSSIENTIAGAYGALGFYDKAIEHGDEALQAAKEAGLPSVKQAQLQVQQGRDVADSGASPAVFLEYAATAEKLLAGVSADNPVRLSVEYGMATLQTFAGKLESALALMQKVVTRQRKLLPADSRELGRSESLLAEIYSRMGDYKAAEPLLKGLLTHSTDLHGEAHDASLEAAQGLAINYLRQKQFAEAEKLLRHYLPIATRLYGADHPRRMGIYSNLGGAIRQQGHNAEARPYYQHVLDWALETRGAETAQAVMARANLANLLRDTGELDAAESLVREALVHIDAALGKNNGARGQTVDLLGTILTRKKKYSEAAATFDRAWNIYSTASGYGPDHPLAQETVQHQIELYQVWDKPVQVKRWQARLTPEADTSDDA